MSAESGQGSITSVLTETRVFPPPPDFARQAHVTSLEQYEALWNWAKDDPEGFWAEQAQAVHWFKTWDKVLDWSTPPFAKWFVGATDQRLVQLRRPPLRGPEQEQGRDRLGGRAGRPPRAPLPGPPARGLEVRQRAQGARRQEGRRRRGLHADGPRAGRSRCWPAPDRGAAHGRLRRLQRRGARRAGSRTARPRCSSPPTAATAAARSSRSRGTPTAPRPSCPTIEHVVVLKRTGHDDRLHRGPRPLVARPDGRGVGRLPRRAARQRAPALHPLHLGLDRQAQGHPPHDRRLPRRHDDVDASGSSTSRTTTPTSAPPTSAG